MIKRACNAPQHQPFYCIAKPSKNVPPNQRMHPTPLRGPEIGAILIVGINWNAVPIYAAARVMRHALGRPDATLYQCLILSHSSMMRYKKLSRSVEHDHLPCRAAKGTHPMPVIANAMVILFLSDKLWLWLMLCIALVLGEGGLFYLVKKQPLWRAFRDSLIVNSVSIALGFGLGQIPFFQGNPDSPIPDVVTPLLFMIAAWGLSVGAEGGVLALLEHNTGYLSWRAAFVANSVSGIVLFGLAMTLVFFML